jgi:NADH-quinone oxidoreductase subunit M
MNLAPNPEAVPFLSVLIFSPLVAAGVAAFLRHERALRWCTLVFTLAAAAGSLPLYFRFNPQTPDFQFAEHAAWIPWLKINYTLGVDGISLLLVLLTTLLMPLCVLASWRYITTRVKEFMVCLLVMESAMVGVFCALDCVLFFVFWEAMLIPMALLIGIWGGPRKVYAALKFFIYTMAGSVLLLVAILALSLWDPAHPTFSIPEMMGRAYAPGFQTWIFLAFALSFAIKVPMFPFHTWLPAAHVEAPTAGSVLLASVLLKMGTYGFLRFCLPITPLATQAFMPWMLGLSVAAILYGGLAALAQSDLKKLVAYSSVGHMGFATLGIFVLNQSGLEGALLVMINHGVTTGALFIAVGIIYERLHTRELDRTAGLGKRMPVFAGFLGVFALSSLAFPGTNSFLGEFLVLVGGFGWARDLAQAWSTRLMLLVVPGVVLAAAYNLRMLQRVAYGGTKNPDHSALKDLGLREVLTLAPLLVFVFWIGLHPQPFTRVLHVSVENLLKQVRGPAAAVAQGSQPLISRKPTDADVSTIEPGAPGALPLLGDRGEDRGEKSSEVAGTRCEERDAAWRWNVESSMLDVRYSPDNAAPFAHFIPSMRPVARRAKGTPGSGTPLTPALSMNLPFKPVGTHSTASLTSPEQMGTRWNASLPDSRAPLAMVHQGDLSPLRGEADAWRGPGDSRIEPRDAD